MMPDTNLSALPKGVTDYIAADRYLTAATLPTRADKHGATLMLDTESARSWVFGEAIVTERVATAQLFHDLKAQADGPYIDLALSRDFKNAYVRSGHYDETGNAFYWAVLLKGDQSYVLRVEYNHPGSDISSAENKITKAFACSADFKGVHLPCFK